MDLKMPMPPRDASIDDAAVTTATGKGWGEWFALLRAAELDAGSSGEVTDWLDREHSVPSWWRQAIATEFERAGETADCIEMPDGFEVEVSATLLAGREAVFQLWADDGLRARWLRRADLAITDLRPTERVRARWLPLDSELEVDLAEINAGETLIKLRHWKLPNAQAAEKLERFWQMVIDRMREHVID